MKSRHWLRLSPARSHRLRTAQLCAPTVVWCARFFEFPISVCALRAATKTIALNLAALRLSRWRSRLGRERSTVDDRRRHSEHESAEALLRARSEEHTSELQSRPHL